MLFRSNEREREREREGGREIGKVRVQGRVKRVEGREGAKQRDWREKTRENRPPQKRGE